MFVGQPILAVAAESETLAQDAHRQDQARPRGAAVHGRSAREPVPGRRGRARSTATSSTTVERPAELKSAKWSGRDFAARRGRQAADGRAGRRVVVRRRRCGLREGRKLVLDETFVTAGNSHHSMEPRSAMAYWQNGKCFVFGSSQSQSFVGAGARAAIDRHRARRISSTSPSTCGGGFGSKGSAYPIMAVPALHGEEDRHAGDDADQPRRGVLPRLRAHGFQGRIKIGFDKTGASRRPICTSCRRTGRHTGFPDWPSAGETVSLALSAARDALPRHRSHDEHAAALGAARPGPQPDRRRDRAADRQGREATRRRPARRSASSTARRMDAKLGAEPAVPSRAATCSDALEKGAARVRLETRRSAAAARRRARRSSASASDRRSIRPASPASTASCASRPTARCTSTPASAISARTRTPAHRASPPRC